jgi:hypothetical protein
MNPTHAPTITRRTRTTGDVARALAATLALAGFVLGVPAALAVVAPWGGRAPGPPGTPFSPR